MKNVIEEKHRELDLPVTVNSCVMNVIPAPTTPYNDSTSIRNLMEGLLESPISPLNNCFGPKFLTVAPPILPFDDELVWFNFSNRKFHKVQYNCSNNVGVQAKRLIDQAFNQALSLPDQQLLLDELKKDPNLVYQIGLTPDKVRIYYKNVCSFNFSFMYLYGV